MTLYRIGVVAALASVVMLADPARARGQASTQPAPAATPATAGPGVAGRHGLGFTGGLLSGVGFAYRRHFTNGFGMHIGGVAWGSKTDSFMNVGFEGIRTLSRSDRVRFYAVAGTGLIRNDEELLDYSTCRPPDASAPNAEQCAERTRHVSGSLSFGGGIGMEFTPGRHIGLSMEVPLSLMLELEEADRFGFKGIYPIPSVAIVYYF